MNRAFKSKIVCIGCMAVTAGLLWKNLWNEYKNMIESHAKYRNYFQILNQWMRLKEKNESLERYFVENHFKTIAIYGMGVMGKHLAEELKDSEHVEIVYGIDQAADRMRFPFQVLKADEDLSDVDVIIVTPVLEFDNIREKLRKKLECPIISLAEVFE